MKHEAAIPVEEAVEELVQQRRFRAYRDSGFDWLGRLPEHWGVVPLRWYLSVGSGDYLSNKDFGRDKTEDTPYPVIGGNGKMGFTDRINTPDPTIVLGRVGALCGNAHLVDAKCWVTDNALRLSNIHRFDLCYLKLQFETMNLNRWANTNAQPLITGGMVNETRAVLPPLGEQQAIADDEFRQAAHANTIDKFRFVFDKALETLCIDRMEQNEDLFAKFMNDQDFQKLVREHLLRQVYAQIREEEPAEDAA